MDSSDRRHMTADSVVDELTPDDFDWPDAVRRYPLAALAVAAVGGYILGRTRGDEILGALSGFAVNTVTSQVNSILGQDVL